uniref:Uncharacterized protein n=1 Tax=Romanomermis culicivorax TaxID=13658 RepID=A0A915KG50_ROMCU
MLKFYQNYERNSKGDKDVGFPHNIFVYVTPGGPRDNLDSIIRMMINTQKVYVAPNSKCPINDFNRANCGKSSDIKCRRWKIWRQPC